MQKKIRIVPLSLVLALCLSLCANAAVLRMKNDFEYTPKVTVSGQTANCSLAVDASSAGPNAKITADIDVQVKTSSGNYTNIAGWTWTGTGTLSRSDPHTDSRISKGSCRMRYTITVNGSNGTDTVSGYVYG